MNKINTLIFDIDGTLLNSEKLILESYEYTLKKYSLGELDRNKLYSIFGRSLKECYSTLFPGENVSELCETHLTFQHNNLSRLELFPNVEEVLKQMQIKKINLSALTVRAKKIASEVSISSGLANYIAYIVSSEDVEHQKPNPEGIKKILKHFKVKNENAIIIGDTEADIQAGKNAGIVTIGVTYGFGKNVIKESKPDFLINNFLELPNIVFKSGLS